MLMSSNQVNDENELIELYNEIERFKIENNDLLQELQAINHHRTILRDTIEQLDRELKDKIDIINEYQSKYLDSNTNNNDQHQQHHYNKSYHNNDHSIDIEDELRRRVHRYQARSIAMEELATIYRTSILALYSDGASYSAAQYGWQPINIPQGFVNKGLHLIGVGWIERELNVVKHSYEEEIKLLDHEVIEIRNKLRQANNYTIELRKQFDENMKSMYRYI